MIGTGAMTDPFIPLEMEIGYTRRCLEIIERYGFGLAIQTKSDCILRDLELLKVINEKAKCVVQMTMTTFDEDLCRVIEPNVCTTRRRFEALKIFKDNGIPTVVWLSPILPFINDTKENLLGILDYCYEAGVYGIINYGFGVTMREGNREYFYAALDRYFPGLKNRYQKKYGQSYELKSDNHDCLMQMFYNECEKRGILSGLDDVHRYISTFPQEKEPIQLSL